MTHYVYIRVSSEKQGDSGLGLEAQEASCRKLAKRLGAISIVVFSDIIPSASEIEDRPGLSRILADIRKGDTLIVAKRDRIAREPRLISTVEWILAKRKVALYSAAGEGSGLPEDDVSGIMQRGMFDLFAKIERAMIRKRTKDALAAKRDRGEIYGKIPYGRQLLHDGKHTGRCTNRECPGCLNLVDNPTEIAALDAIAAITKYETSCRAIARELNRMGIPTRKGTPWGKSQIERILERTINRE